MRIVLRIPAIIKGCCYSVRSVTSIRTKLPRWVPSATSTTVPAGANNGAMPQTMRSLADIIRNARYVEIADAGPIPGIERLDDFDAALEDFLR